MEIHIIHWLYWIPAFAGMTVVRPVMGHADIIPAFAGMTVVRPVMGHADIIPAFAGMTVIDDVPA